MSSYSYVAVNPEGRETRGTVDVLDQSEALRRIREMGLFPTKVLAQNEGKRRGVKTSRSRVLTQRRFAIPGIGGKVKSTVLTGFTRQIATLVEAGLPLLRGLRILQEQEQNPTLKRIIGDMSLAIEGGSSFGEALAMHPRVFDRLFVNMVKAGEISGAMEITLRRLAEFMEKARRIKGKVKSAMFYPCAVLVVAFSVLTLMMVFVVPRFQEVMQGLGNGQLPAFTRFVIGISNAIRAHFVQGAILAGGLCVAFLLIRKTTWGRKTLDRCKLWMPVFGPIFRKLSISRFTRTLGTLMGSGVPILQALTIVKETTGNVIVGNVVSKVHDMVKEGDPIAPTLKASGVFPALVAGMVDVGEQTGALPDMLMKIADNYEEEADNAVGAMTSLLEPFLLVFLAVVVGSIVIALFLPLFTFDPTPVTPGDS